jgi:hypothetical protein
MGSMKLRESQNGLENRIHILEVYFRVPEKFQIFSISYRIVPKGSGRGPEVGPTYLGMLWTQGRTSWPNQPGTPAFQGPAGQGLGQPYGSPSRRKGETLPPSSPLGRWPRGLERGQSYRPASYIKEGRGAGRATPQP